MKTRLIVLSLIFTIIVSLIAAGCQSPAPSPTPKPSPSPTPAPAPSLPSIKIGHLRPLTGHQAQTGERMVRGFAFALEQDIRSQEEKLKSSLKMMAQNLKLPWTKPGN
jgi:hypothetical protein